MHLQRALCIGGPSHDTQFLYATTRTLLRLPCVVTFVKTNALASSVVTFDAHHGHEYYLTGNKQVKFLLL